jgi:hypothetical protein
MLLATFCIRLACGLAGALLVLLPNQVAPRFYRVQFLIVLGLAAGAGVLLWQSADYPLLGVLAAAILLAFFGSVTWMLEGSPGGVVLTGLTFLALTAALVLNVRPSLEATEIALGRIAEEASSAALLGAATSAMLMGHSYLVAPAMSIVPLVRLLIALFAAILVRMLIAGLEPGIGKGSISPSDAMLWLPVRWGLGFVGPLILTWMAWQCAKIRSTQSATGILYVVVILCFIGELTGQLLPPAQDSHSLGRYNKASVPRPFSENHREIAFSMHRVRSSGFCPS